MTHLPQTSAALHEEETGNPALHAASNRRVPEGTSIFLSVGRRVTLGISKNLRIR
jgi:hypothetical protein